MMRVRVARALLDYVMDKRTAPLPFVLVRRLHVAMCQRRCFGQVARTEPRLGDGAALIGTDAGPDLALRLPRAAVRRCPSPLATKLPVPFRAKLAPPGLTALAADLLIETASVRLGCACATLAAGFLDGHFLARDRRLTVHPSQRVGPVSDNFLRQRFNHMKDIARRIILARRCQYVFSAAG